MALDNSQSRELMKRAEKVIPGGVNSPVRAFKGVGGNPLFIRSADGAFMHDADGNQLLDFVGSWGPMILGHGSEVISAAISEALSNGTSFGAPTEPEIELAELVCSVVPGLDMVRMVNSGTEATMSALRLARGFTGRDYILKCHGCYHGHADSLLVSAGSGIATFGIPGSPGVPEAVAELTLCAEFNDLQQINDAIGKVGADKVAAIIIEPVPGNMGMVLPEPGYLQGLRDICSEHGILLIFDEVMSGFRVALGGATERFGVQPDLITLGKVIGGGLPVGAFGGRREVMEHLAPNGPVYQAGTLSGNPLAMAAGMAAVKTLVETNPYPELEELSSRWSQGMSRVARENGIPLQVSSCGSMVGMFFSETAVRNFAEAKLCDIEMFTRFFQGMLSRGIYLAPSAFEAGFVSVMHTPELIDRTIAAAKDTFAEIKI
jgi:glutamate-1-semialdehyde 2,1-aminomutase